MCRNESREYKVISFIHLGPQGSSKSMLSICYTLLMTAFIQIKALIGPSHYLKIIQRPYYLYLYPRRPHFSHFWPS
jgi:hypothetical protein